MSGRKNPGSGAAASQQRVFVALWPPPAVRTRLSQVAEDLAQRIASARRVEPSNLHLTVAFIGPLRSDRVVEVAQRLVACAESEFDWLIDRVGHFEGARVVWAGGPRCAPLLALAARVRALIDAMRIDYDPKPFAPHVTLLRDVPRRLASDSLIDPAIEWPCRGPNLVRSEQGSGGVVYTPVAAL
jgi:2'-5' RNA ligase